MEIERDQQYGRLHYKDKMSIRDRISKRLGERLSGRQLARYLKLIELPPEIQTAVELGDLTMAAALKILNLPGEERTDVYAAIKSGEAVVEIVKNTLKKKTPLAEPCPSEVYQHFMGLLKKDLDFLLPHTTKVAEVALQEDAVVWKKAIEFFEDLETEMETS